MAKIFGNISKAYQKGKLKALNPMPGVIIFLKPYRKIAKVIIHIGKLIAALLIINKNKNSNLSNLPDIKIKHKIIAMKSHTLRVKFCKIYILTTRKQELLFLFLLLLFFFFILWCFLLNYFVFIGLNKIFVSSTHF